MANKQIALLVVLVVCLFHAVAFADTNVAVMPFKGQDVDAVQSAVEDAVREQYAVTSGARVIGAARKMGVTQATDDNLARVARKLRLDALLYGQLVREGKKLELRVLVRSGKTGAPVGEPFSVRLAGERLEGRQRDEFLTKLEEKLAGLSRARRDSARDDRAEDPDSEELAEDKNDRGDERDERQSEQERRDAEEKAAEREAALSSLSPQERADLTRSPAIQVAAGVGVRQRSLTFSGGSGLGDAAPPDYTGLMPLVQIAGEVYPWAFNVKTTGWKRHTGLIVHFEKSMFLESQSATSPGMTVPSNHQGLGLGVVYRMLRGSAPTDSTLKFSMGFNKSSFSTEGGGLDLPNVSYTFVDPGVVWHKPFNNTLALNLTGRLLYVLAAGQIQDATQYGAGTTLGADLDANVSYALGDKLSVQAGLRANAFMLKFTKQGTKSDRDLDGMKDISGAIDRYLGGYVQAGYWF